MNRFALGAAVALVSALVAALGLPVASAAQPSHLARSAQVGRPAEFFFSVDGDTLTIDLVPYDAVVGAIEIEITNAPTVVGDCTPISGVGACNDADGSLHLVALNPTGWTEPDRIASITFVEPMDLIAAALTTLRVTDLSGVDLEVIVDIPFEPVFLAPNGDTEPRVEAVDSPVDDVGVAVTSEPASATSGPDDDGGPPTAVIVAISGLGLAVVAFVVLRSRR